MTDETFAAVVVAVIGALAALGAAAIAAHQAQRARRATHTETLEKQLASSDRDRHLLYLWNRQLVDHIYRGKGPPPPAPPDGLFVNERRES